MIEVLHRYTTSWLRWCAIGHRLAISWIQKSGGAQPPPAKYWGCSSTLRLHLQPPLMLQQLICNSCDFSTWKQLRRLTYCVIMCDVGKMYSICLTYIVQYCIQAKNLWFSGCTRPFVVASICTWCWRCVWEENCGQSLETGELHNVHII